ncbi:MAG: MraY family glycosyltransferase [Anaerolineae bacterium]
MAWWPFVTVAGVSLVVALIVTPLAAAWGRNRGIVDRPGQRRWHSGEIPRTGGIALFVAFMAAALLAQWLPVPRQDPKEVIRFLGIVLGTTFLLVVGFIDDRFELRPAPQYLAQAIAGLIAIAFLVFIERVMNPFTDELRIFPYWFTVLFTLVWIMGMINTINFLERSTFWMDWTGWLPGWGPSSVGSWPSTCCAKGSTVWRCCRWPC